MKLYTLLLITALTVMFSSLASAAPNEHVNIDGVPCVMGQSLQPTVIIKKKEDHIPVKSPFCGQLIIVSTPNDNPSMDVAVAINIRPTKAHFHKHFQEIYMVLDGSLTVQLYDPSTEQVTEVTLEANELAMIPPGVHHRITEASEYNRLQVMCLPGFNADDEHASDKI